MPNLKHIERIREKHSRYKHGMTGIPIYKKWEGMKRRCLNFNDDSYRRYGAKGITVSNEWLSFENFFKDMGHTFKLGLSLDRIDNTKGYSKHNCRWVTLLEQARNKRSVRRFNYKGKNLTVREIAGHIGMKPASLYRRLIYYGWPLDNAITVPVSYGNKYIIHKPLPHGKVN